MCGNIFLGRDVGRALVVEHQLQFCFMEKARRSVADGPQGAPKEVAALPGVVGFHDIAWSPDGRWIAASAYVAASPKGYTKKYLLSE